MKFLINIGITALTALCLGLMLSWWAVAIAGLLAGFFFNKSGTHDFFAGFIAIFLLWGASAWYMDYSTGSLLPERVGEIFQVNGFAMVIFTALIGGIGGGLASLTGGHLRRMISTDPE